MHDLPARLFLCATCRVQVLVYSHCDHGQRYCASGCAAITRQCHQREASQRYQQSGAGRHKHAAGTRRWRQRRAVAAKKVTHQGSQPTPADAVLPAIASPRQSRQIHSTHRHAVPRHPPRLWPRTAPAQSSLRLSGAATGAARRVPRLCAMAFFATKGALTMAITPELRAQILRLYLAERWRSPCPPTGGHGLNIIAPAL